MTDTTFRTWLRDKLDEPGAPSTRSLGERLDPYEPERGRRNVYRWLNGIGPSEASRRAVAEAFGVPVDEVPAE
jgi:hypothetical protein